MSKTPLTQKHKIMHRCSGEFGRVCEVGFSSPNWLRGLSRKEKQKHRNCTGCDCSLKSSQCRITAMDHAVARRLEQLPPDTETRKTNLVKQGENLAKAKEITAPKKPPPLFR